MATYGGGTTYTAEIQTANISVNVSNQVVFTSASDKHYLVRFLSQSLPTGTSMSGTTSFSIQHDNGLGSWVTAVTWTEASVIFAPGSSAALAGYFGVNGNKDDGYFVMSPGMRVICTPATGGGGTCRVQMSVITLLSS